MWKVSVPNIICYMYARERFPLYIKRELLISQIGALHKDTCKSVTFAI